MSKDWWEWAALGTLVVTLVKFVNGQYESAALFGFTCLWYHIGAQARRNDKPRDA